jgi:Tfp pilus assembly protein PilP
MKKTYLWAMLIFIPLGNAVAQEEMGSDQEIRPEDVASNSETSPPEANSSEANSPKVSRPDSNSEVGVGQNKSKTASDAKLIAQSDKPDTDMKDVPQDETWDSFTPENAAKSIALDITNGVRVNDIVLPSSEYHFASFGRPDPFIPQMKIDRSGEAVRENRPGGEEIQITSILQKYPLAELVVVGIWSPQNRARKALISCPTGQGVVVQIGDPMGIRAGKIISINSDHLMVREFEISFDGTRQFEDKEVWLKGKQPEEKGTLTLKPKGNNLNSSNIFGDQNSYPNQPNSNQIPSVYSNSGTSNTLNGEEGDYRNAQNTNYKQKLLSGPSSAASSQIPPPPQPLSKVPPPPKVAQPPVAQPPKVSGIGP